MQGKALATVSSLNWRGDWGSSTLYIYPSPAFYTVNDMNSGTGGFPRNMLWTEVWAEQDKVLGQLSITSAASANTNIMDNVPGKKR